MARLTESEIVTALREEIHRSEGYDSDTLAEVREKALDYYYGRARGDEMEGRSQVQSMDLADMVEAVLAQILPSYEVDNVVSFEPESEDDEDQAKAESDAVNYMIQELNNGFVMFYESIKDALLQRNGIVKVWVDEKEETETRRFENVEPIALARITLNDDPNQEAEVTDSSENSDGTINATIKFTRYDRKLRVSSVPPENFLFSENFDSIYLDEVPFCAERELITRSELIEKGYSKNMVKDLPVMTMDTKNDAEARNRDRSASVYHGSEPSQDLIEVYYCYYRIDADGDGISELNYYVLAGNKLLEKDTARFVPYASGTPFIQPHRFNGLGLYDKLKEVQDVKTKTLRNYLDNHDAANNARLGAVEGMVNMDDATNSRPGGIIRVTAPDALIPIPRDDIGMSSQALLDYMDKVRSARGGAALDLQTAEAQIAGETAHGIERQYTAREQLAALMSRTLAETLIASTYKMVHKAMRFLMPGRFNFRIAGQFQQTDPSQWQERERVNVKTGLSVNERMAKAASIAEIVGKQEQYIQMGQGGIMTDASKLHNALSDWCAAKGIDNPERYWTDPQSPEAQQAMQQAQQQQAMEQQQQQAMMQQQAQMQQQLFEMQAALEKYKHDSDLQYKYWSDRLDAEIEEAKLVGDAATKMRLERLKNEGKNDNNKQQDNAA